MELKEYLVYTGMIVVIFGAILEVVSLINTKRNILVDQASTFWGYNPQLYISLTEQKIRSIAGFVCIFIGFAFQFIELIIIDEILALYYVPYTIAASINIFFAIAVLFLIKVKIRIDINYYLIPNELLKIKNLSNDIQNKSGDGYKKYEELILKDINRLSEGLKFNYTFKDLIKDEEKIVDLLSRANKYTEKHKVHNFEGKN